MNAGSKAFRRPRQQPATNRSIRENPHAVSAVQIRDRIKELRRVRASELVPNPKNWRRHPQSQIVALRAVLNQVGYADALLARELPDGKLLLIDGHLRAETTPQVLVPVLVLDLNEQEADLVMATLDPLDRDGPVGLAAA